MAIPRTVPFAAAAWLTLFASSLVSSHARDLSNHRLPTTRSSEAVAKFPAVLSWFSPEDAGHDRARGDIGDPTSHRSSPAIAAAAEVEKPARSSARSAISGYYDGPRLSGEAAIPEWLDRDALRDLEELLKDVLGGPLGSGDHKHHDDDDDNEVDDGGAFGIGDWDLPAGPNNWSDEKQNGGGASRGAKDASAAFGNGERESGAGATTGGASTSRSSSSSAGDRGSIIRGSDCGSSDCGGTERVPTGKRRSLFGKPVVPNLIVAQDGSGNVTNLQDAVRIINSDMSRTWYIVLLKPGRYVGNVEVERVNVVLLGSGAWRTVITGNRSNGAGFDTWDTPSFAAAGNNFVTMGIRFENTARPRMEAAVAFRATGDRTIAYRCVFSGFQDTLNAHQGRQYYRNCAMFGHVDFIYGRHGAAVFDRCRIAPIPRPGQTSPAIIATHGGESLSKREGGFVFYRCMVSGVTPGRLYKGSRSRAHPLPILHIFALSQDFPPLLPPRAPHRPPNHCAEMVLEDLVGAWGDFTGSDTWKDADKKCDHYVGIKCADNGYVINMTIADAGASGAIGVLTKLQSLKYLDLSGNDITGSAASLSKITALSYIDVSGNSNLNTGFSSLTNLKQLKHLDIADTGYEGSISTFVSKLTDLTRLDMSSNFLTGSIPNYLSTLKKLVYLGLSASGEDGLKGTLPSGLGKLTRLNELYLHRNGLSGPVSVLSSLTKLNRLLVGDNNFNGSFPQGFSNLKSLNYLSMRYNGFGGRVPNVISTLKKLTYLSLYNNQFKGIIPRTITSLTKLSNLLLQDNFFDGYVPSFSSLKKLTEVDLSANYFTGPPPSFYKAPTTLNLDDNYFFGSSLPKDKNGDTICAASLAKNCLTIPSSYSCGTKPSQRTAAACSKFCGTSGNVQCGGIRIGICYPSDKVVETSGSTIDPRCLCANGWTVSGDKQKCTK
ncbi:unnamed protein product [Closterium sp. Naga37s-1]|nr:unnamed protein product [Closterium sp. Naga37s-1]